MNSSLSLKEWILMGVVAAVLATLLPLLIVPLLLDVTKSSRQSNSNSYTIVNTSDEALIEQCRSHIASVTRTKVDDTRIDRRSTGMRDVRFNVHGFVKQQGEEYDFQCWYGADRTFSSHYIGRVSLQAIKRQNSLGTTSPF